uniref:DnaJ homolog subfamily C member 4-like n=1 Tax=Phallusia mammillata TaxID=59560 RepID=A0A6F9DBZ7_9ASCI|nr:dnaJ homolog subfamily C member 4-like [Phallusia mammillata]
MMVVSFLTLSCKQLTMSGKLINNRCFSCCDVMLGHYDTLGITRNATTEEIKQAYIEKCKIMHPDLNAPDKKLHHKFVEVNEAYAVLSNAKSRRVYDHLPDDPGYPFQDPLYSTYAAQKNAKNDSENAHNKQLHREMKFRIIPLTILVILIHCFFFGRFIVYSPSRKLYEREILKQENAEYLYKQQHMLQAIQAQKATSISNDKKV